MLGRKAQSPRLRVAGGAFSIQRTFARKIREGSAGAAGIEDVCGTDADLILDPDRGFPAVSYRFHDGLLGVDLDQTFVDCDALAGYDRLLADPEFDVVQITLCQRFRIGA